MILHYFILGSPVTPTVLCASHDIFLGMVVVPNQFHICAQSRPHIVNSHGKWKIPSISERRYSTSKIAWGHHGPHGTQSVKITVIATVSYWYSTAWYFLWWSYKTHGRPARLDSRLLFLSLGFPNYQSSLEKHLLYSMRLGINIVLLSREIRKIQCY